MYFVPHRRRAGIFRRILAVVEQEAAFYPGIAGIRPYVDRENTLAQGAYRALGFSESHHLMFEGGFQ